MMRLNASDITRLILACKTYQDTTGSEYIWDEYEHLITKLKYYAEENCVEDQIVQLQIPMEHLLGWVLAIVAVPFVLTTLYFGAKKGGYYDTDMYKGNGTAH